MTKETLRMQMLAGVITESEYKTKLQENIDSNLGKEELIEKIKNLDDFGFTGDEIKFKGLLITASTQEDEDETPHYFVYEEDDESEDGIFNSTNPEEVAEFVFNMKKDSLNESMIGGIVGVRAINQIPPRVKTDYEMAYEHYLNSNSINENESRNEFEDYLTGLFNSVDLGDEFKEGPQSYTFEKIEWADEDTMGGEEAEMFEPAYKYISSQGKVTMKDPASSTPLTFRTDGEDIVVDFNTEDFPKLNN